jgi:hypothetical protein
MLTKISFTNAIVDMASDVSALSACLLRFNYSDFNGAEDLFGWLGTYLWESQRWLDVFL